MNRCNCENFVHPKDNPYCDDHCRICGHGWGEHISECTVDMDDEVASYPCEICRTGYENGEE